MSMCVCAYVCVGGGSIRPIMYNYVIEDKEGLLHMLT